MSETSCRRALLGLSALVALIHLDLAGRLPISGDEAYYWQCWRHPDWSYFDQPPLMIWLLGLGTELLGLTERGVRLAAIACGFGLFSVLGAASRALFDSTKPALLAAVALLATPLLGLGTMYVSTDLLLAVFYLGVPALAATAILRDRPRLWLLAGLLGGLGGLAKFTAVLYVPPILAMLLLHPNGRRHLRRLELWAGAALGALAVAPPLIWGAQHDWANFTFQLAARHTHRAQGLDFRWLGQFLLPQLGLASPLLAVMVVVLAARELRRSWRERDLPTLYLLLPPFFLLAVFTLFSLRGYTAPHWAAPAYAGLFLVSARRVLERWPSWSSVARRWSLTALAAGALLTVAAHLLLFAFDRIPRDWTINTGRRELSTAHLDRIHGWRELAAHVRELEGVAFDPATTPIVAGSYTTASLLAFYSGGRYDPILFDPDDRRHGWAYFYWQQPESLIGRPALYIGLKRKPKHLAAFAESWGESRELETFTAAVRGPNGDLRPAQSWDLYLGRALRGEREKTWPLRAR